MWRLTIISTILGTAFLIQQTQTCNEAVCGSIVSKCLLTRSCNCDIKNCSTCCKDCFNCLSYLYDECCSCVDMCPSRNETPNYLSRNSHVEEFSESFPDLFQALTAEPDPQNRWNSTTFPVDIDASQYAPKKEIKIHMQSAEQEVAPIKNNVFTLNCTVAFMSTCMSFTKCKSSCQTMGAAKVRWFHDSCCECVGLNCINYGINESRCRDCPPKDIGELVEDENDFDYGQLDDDDEN